MSGEWIGATSLPVVPAKSLFRERREPSRSGDAHLTPSQTHGVLTQADYIERTGNRVVLNLTGADSMRHVEDGDFISHLRSFQGGLEHSSLEGKVSATYTVLASRRRIDSRYYRYLFKSSRYIQGLRTTTDQMRDGQSIRYAQFALLPLPEPSLSWQSQIADYLDRETAEIDAFIADQEELIALLEERGRALILRFAHRGGLDHKSLVATGLPWHRDVPSHWERGANRRALRFKRKVVGAESTNYELLSLTRRGVVPRDIEGNTGKFPASFDGYQRVDRGDLVFCLFDVDETPRTVGLVQQTGMLTGAYSNFVVREGFDPVYLRWYFEAIDDSKAYRPLYTGLRKVIQTDRFLSAGAYFPPLEEQTKIAASITAAVDANMFAIADAREAIALSKERRAALISAAVTGQIDVAEKKRVLV